LTKELLDEQGVSLTDALRLLRQCLPKHAILVGQNIGKDVAWLQLREGSDFKVSKHPASRSHTGLDCASTWFLK
jgi:hypothetical protein